MEYQYEKYIKESCKLLPELEGAVVSQILVNIVDPEFNVVFLDTDKGVFSLQGEMGAEYLGIRKLDLMPEQTDDEGYIVCPYEAFEYFVGKKVIRVHQIGEAWNGHGFELCFENEPEKTIIVQSIYTGDKPKEFEDCLRLGIGNYQFEYKKHNKANSADAKSRAVD
ncbi:hypothetical protein N9H39_04415 [Gammaproteobacteria bacterium]|nr:hypothetical protein [Gammaproteobacteria bacterium]